MDISLTDLVEFPLASTPAKVTKVRELKHRDEYEPAVDFWRPIRDGIVDVDLLHHPWCLVQAVATMCLLRWRTCPPTIGTEEHTLSNENPNGQSVGAE